MPHLSVQADAARIRGTGWRLQNWWACGIRKNRASMRIVLAIESRHFLRKVRVSVVKLKAIRRPPSDAVPI